MEAVSTVELESEEPPVVGTVSVITPFPALPRILSSTPLLPSFSVTTDSDAHTRSDSNHKSSAVSPRRASESPHIAHRIGADAPQFVQRLYKYRDRAVDKAVLAKLAYRRKVKSECPFVPTLIAKQRKSRERTVEDMYREGTERGRRKDSDEENEKAADTFRPALTDRTKEITKNRNPAMVYDHLYSLSTMSVKTTVQNQRSFQPTITKRSAAIVRDKPIDVHLYEDAQRRLKAHSQPRSPSRVHPKPTIGSTSIELLKQRFRKEFTQAANPYDSPLSAAQVHAVLSKLYFLRLSNDYDRHVATAVWNYVKQGSGVYAEELYVFLLAVSGLPTESLPQTTEQLIHTEFHDLWIMRKCLKPGDRPQTALIDRVISRSTRTEDYLQSIRLGETIRAETQKKRVKQRLLQALCSDKKVRKGTE